MSIVAPQAPAATPAKQMSPDARRRLALDALSGVPVCRLAHAHHVSARFVRRQRSLATAALDHAFRPEPPPDRRVLYHLPVTKAFLEQLCLALLLVGHCSIRG